MVQRLGYGLDDREIGARFAAGARNLSLLNMVPGIISSVVKLPGSEVDNSPPSIAEYKNGGDVPPLPLRLYGVVLNYAQK
jgi:hypothetical protein